MCSKVCSVCLYCEKFKECLENRCLRFCSDDNFDNVNKSLKDDILCHNPPECGAELCLIGCYKAENIFERGNKDE